MRVPATADRPSLLLRALALLALALAGAGLAAQEPPDFPEPPEPPSREFSMKQIVVKAGETHRGDISAFAPSGLIEGTQEGDVYLWCNNLRISGTVEGDVFFAGSQLDVTGRVGRSIRSLSGNVVIDGEVDGNVLVTGGSVLIGNKAHIKGNVSAFGGQLTHNGVIDGTLKFTGGTINLNGKIQEDAEITADSINLDQGARIEGDVEYSSRHRKDAEIKAITGGDVSYDERPNIERERDEDEDGVLPSKTSIFFKLLFLCASFLFGCALLALFRAYEPEVVGAIRADALRCAGIGFVSILVTIAVCLSAILIVTLIFIPIYLILYVVACYLAKIPVALWVGRTILAKLNRTTGPYAALGVGLVVLYAIFAIPVLGWIVWFAVILLGLGAMITTYLAHREARKAAGGSPQAPPAEPSIAS